MAIGLYEVVNDITNIYPLNADRSSMQSQQALANTSGSTSCFILLK